MLTLPRAYVSPHAAGTWFKDHEGRVWLKCPPNGHVGRLDDHTIHPDGTVRPSVECPSCAFHEEVMLEDWVQ